MDYQERSFGKTPEAFINNLEDKDAKLTLEFYMQIV